MIVYGCFSHIQKMLGRTETQTRDRMYCQTIRTVRDISRDDRPNKNCDLQFATTDRLKEIYSIDNVIHHNVIDCITLPQVGWSHVSSRNSLYNRI